MCIRDRVSITGIQEQPAPKDVTDAIQAAINHKSHETMQLELAFFGGSFTALDHDYMVSLLEAAQPFVCLFYPSLWMLPTL